MLDYYLLFPSLLNIYYTKYFDLMVRIINIFLLLSMIRMLNYFSNKMFSCNGNHYLLDQ